MLGRAAASITCGRLAALALLLAVFCDRPSPSRGQEPAPAEPLAVFPMGPERWPCATFTIGGKDYQCLLDTGSNFVLLDERLEPEVGPSVGDRKGRSYCYLPASSLGQLQVPSGAVAYYGDLEPFRTASGMPLMGIVGMNVLSNVALTLDFDQSVSTLHAPDYQPPMSFASCELSCEPRPYTVVEVDDRTVLMMVDSGSFGELSLPKDSIDQLHCRGHTIAWAKSKTITVDGDKESSECLLSAAQWHNCRFEQVQVTERRADRLIGTIGRLFLARFNCTLQFAEERLLRSPSKWHEARWWPELRGMTIAEIGGRRIVFAVRSNSEAFRAGIRPDDEVDLPPDFYQSWSLAFTRPYLEPAFPTIKPPLNWESSSPMPIRPRQALWKSGGPLALRVRKPGEAGFVTARVEDDKLPTNPVVADVSGEKAYEDRTADRSSDGTK